MQIIWLIGYAAEATEGPENFHHFSAKMIGSGSRR